MKIGSYQILKGKANVTLQHFFWFDCAVEYLSKKQTKRCGWSNGIFNLKKNWWEWNRKKNYF
jgi:hypothetical protein